MIGALAFVAFTPTSPMDLFTVLPIRLVRGMRQTGILAAAGLYALENNIDRLAQDHANCQRLADGLTVLAAQLPILQGKLTPLPVQTNILFTDIDTELAAQMLPYLAQHGVALTANPFDTSGLESAFYVNVQIGDIETGWYQAVASSSARMVPERRRKIARTRRLSSGTSAGALISCAVWSVTRDMADCLFAFTCSVSDSFSFAPVRAVRIRTASAVPATSASTAASSAVTAIVWTAGCVRELTARTRPRRRGAPQCADPG